VHCVRSLKGPLLSYSHKSAAFCRPFGALAGPRLYAPRGNISEFPAIRRNGPMGGAPCLRVVTHPLPDV
jgi:hypothetical protein